VQNNNNKAAVEFTMQLLCYLFMAYSQPIV
jgi:hypothetical protein